MAKQLEAEQQPLDQEIAPPETKKKISIGLQIARFGLSGTVMGILFTLQRWPGAKIQLENGLVFLAIALAVLLLIDARRIKQQSTALFARIAAIGALGLLLMVLPNGTMVDLYFRGDPDMAAAMKAHDADPNNAELRAKVDSIHEVRMEQDIQEYFDEE